MTDNYLHLYNFFSTNNNPKSLPSFYLTNTMTTSLRILFLTDIHLSFLYVQKLHKWHTQTKISFDIILIGGDTANCDQNNKTHNQQQQLQQANKILTQIQQIFNCKMYFIPGNHDPLEHYKAAHCITPEIVSTHERRVKIAENLELMGFGGSVPGYLDSGAMKQVWKGYPFDSNEALTAYCEENKIFFEEPQDDIQRIYLTHCGPFDYETSINRFQLDAPIYGGAKYFNRLVEHKNVLLYLHGHVHCGSRYVKYLFQQIKGKISTHHQSRKLIRRRIRTFLSFEGSNNKPMGTLIKALCPIVTE